jgi:hypothetical protein
MREREREKGVNFSLSYFFYKLKILILRIICYEKPLRVVILKYLSLKYKTFRPHYETILYQSCLEAKKLGYNEVSILELGVAGGNGIISLENYKKKIEKFLNIKITIYGFDNIEGLPEPKSYKDLPFLWKKGLFTLDKILLKKKIDSQIICGDIENTLDEFVTLSPKNISAIFFDLDYYSSTKSFLKQIKKLQNFLSPRVYCYFDDIFDVSYAICEFNGERLAIKEFNEENNEIKIANTLDNICDFKFPFAKNMLYLMHNFGHQDYNKYIGQNNINSRSLSLGSTNVDTKIF